MDVPDMLSGQSITPRDGRSPANAIHTHGSLEYETPISDHISPEKKSAASSPPKTVAFPLILSKVHQSQARLPLRVNVRPHDTTESIISTVKNFYGLYEGNGVAFEDDGGTIIIPRYENVSPDDTIHVRITKEVSSDDCSQPPSMWPSRPASRTQNVSQGGSPSRRLGSTTLQQHWSSAVHHSEGDAANGYSDSDGGSVSGRRAKNDNLASAEISVDNILEGNRRKKAKFESSELPLYIPPQMPITTSISSTSPQKQPVQGSLQSPLPKNPYTPHSQALPSPYSNGQREYQGYVASSQAQNVSGGCTYLPPPKKTSRPAGVLPTPDPTIGGSVISDEDVAIQLMRLGDASNFSHGRTSTSTADDALSGKAEVASSAENSDEDSEEDEPPPRKKQRGDAVFEGVGKDENDEAFKGNSDEAGLNAFGNAGHRSKPKALKPAKIRTGSGAGRKSGKARASSMSKPKLGPLSASKVPPSPYSFAGGDRKESVTSTATSHQQFGTDDEDLSSKPRCQRCRKSKKGCDRQRPCGRCKDAGIGIEGCVSEDEGNGRKGKYGRHMGIPVKKTSVDGTMSPAESDLGASKKRKR